MRRAAKGFTLIEALLALAILALAVAGVLTVRANAVRNALRARNQRLASMLAGRLLSEVALAPPEQSTPERDLEGYPGYSYRFVLSTVAVEPLGTLGKLRIEVYYPPGDPRGGRRGTLALETLLGLEED